MMEIPISSNSPHFSQEHILFGHGYLLEFEWLEKEQIWVLHIYNLQESPVALGLKVVPGWPIFIDQTTGIIFWLMAKNPNASLDLSSLHRDFVLIAEALDETV